MKKVIFVHTLEIFDADILIAVGASADDLKKYVQTKLIKPIRKMYSDEDYEKFKEIFENTTGCVFEKIYDGKPFYLLRLARYSNEWQCIETLLHEIVHYVQFQITNRSIENEKEFQAYMIESTFRSLRKALGKKFNFK